jgi:hypothetical protein
MGSRTQAQNGAIDIFQGQDALLLTINGIGMKLPKRLTLTTESEATTATPVATVRQLFPLRPRFATSFLCCWRPAPTLPPSRMPKNS